MISILSNNISYKYKSKRPLYKWIRSVILGEGKKVGNISIILCSDEFILQMNNQHLKHNYFTDVITFDYSDEHRKILSGEIYISIDMVNANALKFKSTPAGELHRVIIHGVLHLCGYNDKSSAEKQMMRKKENESLSLFHVKH